MKKILLCSGLFLSLYVMPVMACIAQPSSEIMKTKGKLSPNTENEDNEPDPQFASASMTPGIPKKAQSGSKQHVSELDNGLQIVEDIINKMMSNEYNFSLLSQHKYMVNNCLGFKVSAGEFKLKFEKPVVEMTTTGKIRIKLEVDKIKFSAFKLRMKPCSKLEHLGSPCHFGTKFEVGGEATDLVMKAVIDPVANGMLGSQGFCFFAFEGNLDVKWTIGGFNLRPMQNNLDNLGKDMVEDALNGGMIDFFYRKFIEFSRDVIPQYYAHCENAYDLSQMTGNLTESAAGITNNNSSDAAKWTITPVASMKGVLGRLNTEFPAGVDWSIDIKTTQNKFITNRSVSGRQNWHDLAPGAYNFRLNTITVESVPIEKGKQTRLKTGVLSILSMGDWQLYDDTKKKFHTSGNKPKKIALPVGNYQLKLDGQFFTVNIDDGKEVEY